MNRVILIGRTTDDIELRYTQNELAFAKFRLAVNRRTKDGGADFIGCTAWGKTAENASRYVKKGNRIGIVGRMQTGSYERDGKKVYTTDVFVEELEFLEKKQSSERPEEGFEEVIDDEGLPF